MKPIISIRKLNTLAFTALITILIGSSFTTQAAVLGTFDIDSKLFPATLCSREGFGTYYGAIENRTTGTKVTYCPVVRDTPYKAPHSLNVLVRDRHPTQNVRCQAIALRSNGVPYKTITKYSSGDSYTPQRLIFNGLNAVNEGTIVIRCDVPPKAGSYSRVISYSILESKTE